MSTTDPQREQTPRHKAPSLAESGALGPPIDPPVFLSDEGVLAPEAPDEARTAPIEDEPEPLGEPEPWELPGDADEGPTYGAEREPWLPDRVVRNLVDAFVVLACVVFVFLQVGPSNILSDTTPAGGDMGAHVWGPAYLRDHLLPSFQLAGWAPDWYDGFPAYQFYMVVPSLLIVLLNVGIFHGWMALLPVLVAAGCVVAAAGLWDQSPRRSKQLLAGAGLALLTIGLPYGVAFKLIAVSGAVTLPIAAYAFGRLAGLQFPTPAMFSAASLVFLFYRGFSIYGGNLPSTLAGEFAFSISLSLGLLYLGVLFRGFDNGKHRGWAAVLLALTGLCHLIPAFWVLGATAIAVIVHPRRKVDTDAGLCALLAGVGTALCLVAVHWHTDVGPWRLDNSVMWDAAWKIPFPIIGGKELPITVWFGGAMLLVAAGLWLWSSQTVRYVIPSLIVGGLLSTWWVLPFAGRSTYVNDMGWERIPAGAPGFPNTWTRYLFPGDVPPIDGQPGVPGHNIQWVFLIALVGVGLSLASRLRVGIFLTACAVALALSFWLLPAGRLWNARLLPFYYLTVMLLAALAFAETVRLIAELVRAREADLDRPSLGVGVGTALSGLLAILVVVGLPLGVLPFKEGYVDEGGGQGYSWPSFSPVQVSSSPASFIPGWADWNFEGYERKTEYREYYEVVQTMKRLGESGGDDSGCGRAMWEYNPDLDHYGTPMALMLLPYWTDGCIGSQEGLYFEASTTTPYHFLMQNQLSEKPSSAQRDMPYPNFLDMTRGVQQMQLMGVRYYMAKTDAAVNAASVHPDLTKVDESGPWVIFEVANSAVVQGLTHEPKVLADSDGSQTEWLEEPKDAAGLNDGPAVRWFMHPDLWDVAIAASGPDEWERIRVSELVPGLPTNGTEVTPAQVTDLEIDREKVEFDVDRVGSPVLVKVSYFPNWSADGAEGPYRVAPNLMVVVPTEEHVELNYGRTSVEWLAYLTTLLGLVGLVFLVRRGIYRFQRALPVPPSSPLVPPPPPER
jgi:hypothetical protein